MVGFAQDLRYTFRVLYKSPGFLLVAVLALMILKQGMQPVAAGVGIGLAASAAVSRVIQSLLYGVSAVDLTVFAGVAAFLAGVALLASYAPALRATRVDPMAALRDQ